MNQSQSQMEPANTITNTSETTPKESTKLNAETAPKADTTLTRTPSKTEKSSVNNNEGSGQVKETLGDTPELPPSLYQESNKAPYLLELFEAPEVYGQLT
jgi:hypothetical protein